jgi:hypothetical protein
VERVFVLEALEAGLGATAVPRDEARDDLVDQERVSAIEEEVELSRLGGSLRGRRVARREPGGHRSLAGGGELRVEAGVEPADERGDARWFFGIIITMNYNDHAPPHFHARYGGDQAIIEIQTLQVLGGLLAPRVMGLVAEWALQHRDELLEDWRLARESAPLNRIAPLE